MARYNLTKQVVCSLLFLCIFYITAANQRVLEVQEVQSDTLGGLFPVQDRYNLSNWFNLTIEVPEGGQIYDLLRKVVLYFPDQTINVPALNMEMNLSSLICYNMTPQVINASIFFTPYIPDNTTVDYTYDEDGNLVPIYGLFVNLTIINTESNCTSDFVYTRGRNGSPVNGSMEFTIYDGNLTSSLQLYQLTANDNDTSSNDLISKRYTRSMNHNPSSSSSSHNNNEGGMIGKNLLLSLNQQLPSSNQRLQHINLPSSTDGSGGNEVESEKQQTTSTSIKKIKEVSSIQEFVTHKIQTTILGGSGDDMNNQFAQKLIEMMILNPSSSSSNNNNPSSSSSSSITDILRVNDVWRFISGSDRYPQSKINPIIKLTEDDTFNGLRNSSLVFKGIQYECDMPSEVDNFESTDSFLNLNRIIVEGIIADNVPDIICPQVNSFVENNLTTIVNNISTAIFNVTSTFYNYEYPRALNERGAWMGVALSLGLIVMVVLYFGITDYLRYAKSKREIADPLHRLNYQTYGNDDDDGGGGNDDNPFRPPPGSPTSRMSDDEKAKLLGDFSEYPPDSVDFSLMRNPKINIVIRYFILVFFLGNIALFISATISVAASVFIYLSFPGITYQTPSLYSFTLISSCIEMWEAGIWPLAFIIGGASGVWPYIKILLMAFAWVVPPSLFSANSRGILIIVLDALGKWSLIDCYVLVLFLASFRVHLSLLSGGINFDMVVVPEYAFYAYLLGLMMSLSITHVVMYYHKKVVEPQIPPTARESLFSHQFKILKSDNNNYSDPSSSSSHRSGGAKRVKKSNADKYRFNRVAKLTWIGVGIVVLIIILVVISLFVGYFIDAFDFNYENSLVGYLFGLDGNTIINHSIFTLTTDLPNTTYNDPSDIGVRTIQVVFFLFSFVIPLLFLTSLIVLFMLPMTSRQQHNFFVIVEILSAWAALDVFMLALIVALLELEQFSIFVVGDRCDGLDKLLIDVSGNDNAVCFTAKSELLEGCWLLVMAVILLDFVGYTIMILSRRVIYERVNREIFFNSTPNLIKWQKNHVETIDENEVDKVEDTYSLTSTTEFTQHQAAPWIRFLASAKIINVMTFIRPPSQSA